MADRGKKSKVIHMADAEDSDHNDEELAESTGKLQKIQGELLKVIDSLLIPELLFFFSLLCIYSLDFVMGFWVFRNLICYNCFVLINCSSVSSVMDFIEVILVTSHTCLNAFVDVFKKWIHLTEHHIFLH